MATTYEPIATTTLSSNTQYIDFTSIPATYTDLRLDLICLTQTGGSNPQLQFNSDTANNYNQVSMRGGTATPTAGMIASNNLIYFCSAQNASATVPNVFTADIFNYASSRFKTVLISAAYTIMGSATNEGFNERITGMWRSTSAITSMRISTNSPSPYFLTGTTATLYGIKAA